MLGVLHPDGRPAGQLHHAAGPTEGGFLISALWDSQEHSGTLGNQTVVGYPPDGGTWASLDETTTFDLPAEPRIVSIRCSKSVGQGHRFWPSTATRSPGR